MTSAAIQQGKGRRRQHDDRRFLGVKGDDKNEGELFGVKNIFRLSRESFLATSGIAEAGAGENLSRKGLQKARGPRPLLRGSVCSLLPKWVRPASRSVALLGVEALTGDRRRPWARRRTTRSSKR